MIQVMASLIKWREKQQKTKSKVRTSWRREEMPPQTRMLKKLHRKVFLECGVSRILDSPLWSRLQGCMSQAVLSSRESVILLFCQARLHFPI